MVQSKSVLKKFLGHLFKYDSLDKCSICLRAKQIRDPFPVSLNNATTLFDLIHCDL